MTEKIFIFDMDGVLLSGEGYRKSFEIAIQYLCNTCGIGDIQIGDEVHARFESIGISSEWEMTPLYFALLLDLALVNGLQVLPSTLGELINSRQHFPRVQLPVVNDQIFKIKPMITRGIRASESILNQLVNNNCFDAFANIRHHPIFVDLLKDTHDLSTSITCQLIQNLTAGTKNYQKFVISKPYLETESVLKTYDQVNVSDEHKHELLNLEDLAQLHCVICTARPSSAPKNAPVDRQPYFPEAETGRQLLGMERIPLVGWGGMQSLAFYTGRNPTEFLKPQPVQTLAAIGCSMGMEYWESLKWALKLTEGSNTYVKDSTLRIAKSIISARLQLSIFEDMENGLIAGQNAKTILEKYGANVDLNLWGITTNPEKEAALRACHARIAPGINEALEIAI